MDLAAVCQSVITNMERVGSIKRCRLARHAAHFAGGLDSEVAVVSLLAPVRGELKRAQRGQALPVEQQSERGRVERVAHRAQVADAERRLCGQSVVIFREQVRVKATLRVLGLGLGLVP